MMEINIEKLLESGMSPESIGKMVQLEAQKKQEKNKKADAEKKAAARVKASEALWDYYTLVCPDDDSIDKNEFVDILSREFLEFEDFITNPLMQQIFKQPTSRCSCKEQTSEPQKCVKNDEWKCMPGYQERTPRVKVNVEELDDAAINKIIRDFVGTLME
jgi:hypothetical protein